MNHFKKPSLVEKNNDLCSIELITLKILNFGTPERMYSIKVETRFVLILTTPRITALE